MKGVAAGNRKGFGFFLGAFCVPRGGAAMQKYEHQTVGPQADSRSHRLVGQSFQTFVSGNEVALCAMTFHAAKARWGAVQGRTPRSVRTPVLSAAFHSQPSTPEKQAEAGPCHSPAPDGHAQGLLRQLPAAPAPERKTRTRVGL